MNYVTAAKTRLHIRLYNLAVQRLLRGSHSPYNRIEDLLHVPLGEPPIVDEKLLDRLDARLIVLRSLRTVVAEQLIE